MDLCPATFRSFEVQWSAKITGFWSPLKPLTYYFGKCSSELAQLVPLPFSRGRSTRYSDRLHDFFIPFLDVTRTSISTVTFSAQLDSGIFCL